MEYQPQKIKSSFEMSPPILDIPTSEYTVRVRMIDPGAVMTVKAELFIKPVQKGHELLNLTCVAFLIEHAPSGKKVMFDLGVRKDYWNLAPVIQKRLGAAIPSLRVDGDTPAVLQENGISLESIGRFGLWCHSVSAVSGSCILCLLETSRTSLFLTNPSIHPASVIWSHYHWDHIGDMSLFPPSTEIVVGSGFKASPVILPGHPEKSESPLNASDFAGRSLDEIDFKASGLQIGGFAAHDFFGDGSFYLLGTPCSLLASTCVRALVETITDSRRHTWPLSGPHVRPGTNFRGQRQHLPLPRRRHMPFCRRS